MAKNMNGIVWKKRILFPLWAVRIVATLIALAAYAYAIHSVRTDDGKNDFPSIAVLVLYMLFLIIILLLEVLAIVQWARGVLHPNTFLNYNSFQTGFWGGCLIVNIVYIIRGASPAGIGYSVGVFIVFLAGLIYAIIMYRRAKHNARQGQYVPTPNPVVVQHTHTGTNPVPWQQQDTSYHAPPQYAQATQPNYPSPYDSPLQPLTRPHGGAADDYYHSQQPTKPNSMV